MSKISNNMGVADAGSPEELTTKQKLDALQERINETESVNVKINKNANSSFIFWHDLSINNVETLLDAGYNMDDLIGRVSMNDTLVRRSNMKIIRCL